MIDVKQGIASGTVVALSGSGGSIPTHAAVRIDDDDASIVCAELPEFRNVSESFSTSVGSLVLVSFEEDGSERVYGAYQPLRPLV